MAVTDDDIRAYAIQYENDPGMIASGMRSNNVTMADMSRALGKTPEQIGAYVNASNDQWLKDQYSAWRNPVTNTPATGGQETPKPATPPSSSMLNLNSMYDSGYLYKNDPPPAPPAAAAPPPAPAAQDPTTKMLGEWFKSYMESNKNPPPQPMQAPPAVQWTVSPQQTTQGILQSVLKENGPLMEAGRNRGLLEANARGVLNSGEGVRAAERALYESAMPIATTDASIYARAGETNANAANQVNMFNAGQTNQWWTSDLDRKMSGYQFGTKLAQEESQFGRELAERARATNLASGTQLKIAGMDYDIADRRLSQDDRQFLKSHALAERQLNEQTSQFAKKLGLDYAMLDNDMRRTSNQQSQFYAQLSADDRRFYDELKLNRDKLDQTAQQFNTEWSNRFTLEGVLQQGRLDLAKMDAENRVKLANIDGQWRSTITNNESVGQAWGTMVEQIGRIQNNPELEEPAKRTLIDNVITSFDSYARFQSKLSGGTLNIDELLNFGAAFRSNKPSTPAEATPSPTIKPGDMP